MEFKSRLLGFTATGDGVGSIFQLKKRVYTDDEKNGLIRICELLPEGRTWLSISVFEHDSNPSWKCSHILTYWFNGEVEVLFFYHCFFLLW